jgi:hypothetical protein
MMKIRKMNIFFFTLVAAVAVLFSGCDDGTSDVTVNYISDDGFGLESSNISFNASTSVSSSSTVDTDDAFYVPVELDELEDGDDPIIWFQFNEDIGSIFNFEGTTTSEDNPEDNIFEINGSDTAVKSYAISGDTVYFTFETDTFSVDDEVDVYFGITSEAGEYYYVQTYFQTQVDITETVVIAANYDDYYAYAVDSDRLYYLNNATDGTHIIDGTDAEDILSATISAGSFGSAINTLDKRANSTVTSDPTNGTYAHVLELYTEGNYTNFITFDLTPVEYATAYTFYLEDSDEDRTELDGTFTYNYDTDGELTDITASVNVFGLAADSSSVPSIETGDLIVCVPSNSRGDFEDCEGSATLTDTMHPFRSDDITFTETSSFTWTGEDWSTHIQDEAHDEGELVSFGTWDITSLTGYADGNVHESYSFDLTSASLTATTSATTSAGTQKSWTEAEVREELSLDDDVELIAGTNNYIWSYISGSTIYVYGGFNCNDGTTGISYSGETWTATGTIAASVTDLSGNTLYFTDGTSDYSTGAFSITIQ